MISEKLWSLVLNLISQGLTKKDAIKASGISETAFYDKQKNDKEFSELVKRAEVQFKLKHLKNISDNAMKGSWQASAWILERKFKREFSKVEYIEEMRDELSTKTDEELNEMLIELEQEQEDYDRHQAEDKNTEREEEEESER